MKKTSGKKSGEDKDSRASGYIVLDTKRSCYGTIMGEKEYDEETPETILSMLIDTIETSRVTYDIWFWGLSLCSEDIISMFYTIGYTDMTNSGTPAKAWHCQSFDYTLATTGTCYRMRVRGHGKRTISIYDASNILGKDLESIANSFCPVQKDPEPFEEYGYLERYTRGVKAGIDSLVSGYKKTPYTISMIASRVFHKVSGIQYNDFMMTDCYKIWLPSHEKDENGKPVYEDLDHFLRPSYKTGYNFMTEKAAVYNGDGITLDINSLYPWVMATKPIPWGDPHYFKGEIPDEAFEITRGSQRYYYVKLKCAFDLKSGYLPYIGINDWLHKWGIPLETSDMTDIYGVKHRYVGKGKRKKRIQVELTLSKTDWELMQKVYDVEDVEIIEGVWYDTSRFVFKDFVNAMFEEKRAARERGDKSRERSSKMILNATAGTLAKIRDRESVKFDIDENGNLVAEVVKTSSQSKSYIHMASAILSYARERIYTDACKYIDRFLYSDTDSLHLAGKEIPEDIVISDKLGDYKLEDTFEACAYYKRKVYAHYDGKFHITYAGLSMEYRKYIEDLLTEYKSSKKLSKRARGEKSKSFCNHFLRSQYNKTYDDFEMRMYDETDASPYDILEALKYISLPNGEKEVNEMICSINEKWCTIIK